MLEDDREGLLRQMGGAPEMTGNVDVRVAALEAANRRLRDEMSMLRADNDRLRDELEAWRRQDVRVSFCCALLTGTGNEYEVEYEEKGLGLTSSIVSPQCTRVHPNITPRISRWSEHDPILHHRAICVCRLYVPHTTIIEVTNPRYTRPVLLH